MDCIWNATDTLQVWNAADCSNLLYRGQRIEKWLACTLKDFFFFFFFMRVLWENRCSILTAKKKIIIIIKKPLKSILAKINLLIYISSSNQETWICFIYLFLVMFFKFPFCQYISFDMTDSLIKLVHF